MKSSGSPPPAPDPTQTANAQSQANIATAIANAQLNRVNQSTPWGSITYTQGATGPNGVPTWSSQIQLSPQQQQLLEQQQGQSSMRNQIAQALLQSSAGRLAQPLDLSGLPTVYNDFNPQGQRAWSGNTQPTPPAFQFSQPTGSSASSAPSAPTSPAPPSSSAPTPTPSLDPATIAAMMGGGLSSAKTPISYQDYLAANPQNNGGSEGGQGTFSGMPQSQWDSLSPDQQWSSIGNMLAIAPNDPRFAALQQQVKGDPSRDILMGPDSSASVPFNSTYYNDPNAVVRSNGMFATSQGNLTPFSQMGNNGGMSDRMWALAALSPIMAGVGAAALGAGAGDAGAAGAVDTGAVGAPDYASELATAGQGAAPSAAAPITDLSTQAAQQNVFSQMLQNLQGGHGLLGLNGGGSIGQRLGTSALVNALMRRPGGGK